MTQARPAATCKTVGYMEVFRWFYNHVRNRGFQPSYREMMDRFGLSPNSVTLKMRTLEKHGYVGAYRGAKRCVPIYRKPDGSPFRGFKD
jgi:SOS-response transcriptional repressor LexA